VTAVTRTELADHVEAAFVAGPAARGDLLQAAVSSRARPEVIDVLRRLPEREFRSLRELWQELADLPLGA